MGLCHICGQHVAACFRRAGGLTLTVLVDGCRNFGDTLHLSVSYSPSLHIVAWLPFQVPPFVDADVGSIGVHET